MTCDDCPNQTYGKCCHQSVKPSVTDFDEDAFLREVQHAQMMHRAHYKQECKRRNEQMLFNERQASMALEASKEQAIRDGIKERNAQMLREELLRKQRLNEEFWRKIRQIFMWAAVILIAYTLIHFA